MKRIFFALGVVIILCILLFTLTGCGSKQQKQKDKINIQTADNTEIAGAKAGEYTLQYGTYKSDLEEGNLLGGTYELKSDGTFTYQNTWRSVQTGEEFVEEATGTYEILYSEEKDKKTWIIKFNNLTGDNEIGFSAFDIIGNNQFAARQYSNTFTLQK